MLLESAFDSRSLDEEALVCVFNLGVLQHVYGPQALKGGVSTRHESCISGDLDF